VFFCDSIEPRSQQAPRAGLFQLADFDVSIPAIVLVVGEHDVANDFFAEAGLLSEFALRETGFDGVAAEVVAEDVFTVEPVFDVVAFDDDAGGVPFANRFQGFICGRREYVVKRGRLAVRADLSIGVASVVEHLVLGTRRCGAGLGDEIFDAVIAGEWEFPFPGELEVVEFFLGDELGAFDFGDGVECAVFDFPAAGGLAGVRSPPVHGLTVEEESPAGGFFGRGELVFSGAERS